MFARSTKLSALAMAGFALAALALTACGSPGSSGASPPPTAPSGTAAGAGCAPMAGDTLVALADDKHLQSADNIVAVANKSVNPAAITAADKVAAALDQTKLAAINKEANVDRKTSAEIAQEFVAANGLTSGVSGGSGKIVVGAAGFSESQTLAEIYRLVLKTAGFDASVKQIANRELYEPALERNEIQIFPEYAATLAEFLNTADNGKNARPVASGDLTATMTALTTLAQKHGLVVGTPSTAIDANAFAVTKATADKYGLKTLSDFATKCSGAATVLAGPPECTQRPLCKLGLEKVYGIVFGSFLVADVDGPQTKGALTGGRATIGLVSTVDAETPLA
jgi:osmoprotectant transport system substrate-binding protein